MAKEFTQDQIILYKVVTNLAALIDNIYPVTEPEKKVPLERVFKGVRELVEEVKEIVEVKEGKA